MAASARLSDFPAHLTLEGGVLPLPRFTGEGSWYGDYEQQHASDGAAGRLVSWHTFHSSWTSWEVHPNGEELVLCVAGAIELIQEIDGAEQSVLLRTGEWVVNPAGVWHTANVPAGSVAECVFITSGLGTQGRER